MRMLPRTIALALTAESARERARAAAGDAPEPGTDAPEVVPVHRGSLGVVVRARAVPPRRAR